PPQSNCPPCTVPDPDNGSRLDIHNHQGGISHFDSTMAGATASKSTTYSTQTVTNTSAKLQERCTGAFRLTAGTPHLPGEFNFTESMLETAGKSLRHSCRSELTRQGISLPTDHCD